MAGSGSSTNERVADALREIGALLSLEKGNRFRARAYDRAASVVVAAPDLEMLVRERMLTSLPGIGPSLAGVVTELVRTGRSAMLERLRRECPPGTAELSRVLSLPRIRALYRSLGTTSLASLRAACRAGLVRNVPGFGEKSEHNLLERIDALASRPVDVLLPEAMAQGERLLRRVREPPSTVRAELAGSLRRRVETIDRLDLAVASEEPHAFLEDVRSAFASGSLGDTGPGSHLLRVPGYLDAHLHVVPPSDFGVALVSATGSAGHVAALARAAETKGLQLDERSLRKHSRRIPVPTEEALYSRLDLAFVPPELREDAGEVEAAGTGELPEDLVRLEDLRGAVHCHTQYSDGRHSIEEMARAAEDLGLAYLTITDHSASATYARGLDLDRLQRQSDEIARVRERVNVRILHGTESDILRDGSLDFPDAALRRLDVIIASIHNRYKMDAEQMTDRLLKALRHPLFKIWGHALGRYVMSRPPFACHMDEVLDAVAESRAAIEVNGDPHRLDMEPRWIREARARGIRFVVSVDAHTTSGLRNARWGVDMARRGWLRREEVLNTLGPDEFTSAVKP